MRVNLPRHVCSSERRLETLGLKQPLKVKVKADDT